MLHQICRVPFFLQNLEDSIFCFNETDFCYRFNSKSTGPTFKTYLLNIVCMKCLSDSRWSISICNQVEWLNIPNATLDISSTILFWLNCCIFLLLCVSASDIPLNSVLKTVAIEFLWKCHWILSFFCLEASCNFSFQSKCQTPYNQQSVVCILVSYYLSNFFYTLLSNHPVLTLGYFDAVISIYCSVFPWLENSLPLILIATLASSDPCLNGIFGGRIYMADYSLEIFAPFPQPIRIKDVYFSYSSSLTFGLCRANCWWNITQIFLA